MKGKKENSTTPTPTPLPFSFIDYSIPRFIRGKLTKKKNF